MFDLKRVTLEHVHPRAVADPAFGEITDDLGNLTILGPRENQGAGNKPFVEKRVDAVVAQLDGKSEGVKPAWGFGPGPGRLPPAIPPRALIELADTNKDGKVSPEEMAEAMKKLFKEADKNGDGVLDERELTEAMQKLAPRPPFGGGPGPGPGPMPPGPGSGRPRGDQ